MIGSAILNIFLDWLFLMVFHWGMQGAALATGFAQLAVAGILLLHFRRPDCQLDLRFIRPDLTIIHAIIANGMPTLFMEASTGVVILTSNWVLFNLGGSLYLSVYTIALNSMWLVTLLVYGVCQAVQPLVSFNHGANQPARIMETLKLGQLLITLVCIAFGCIAVLFPGQLVSAFVANPSAEMIELGSRAMRFYGFATVPMGINILVMTIYQAVARSRVSSMISLCRGLLLPVGGLLILPVLVGEEFVWANLLLADLTVLAGSLLLFRAYNRGLQKKMATPEKENSVPLAA